MSTQLATTMDERAVTFVPLGEQEPITLTFGMVKSHIACKTKSGKSPSDQEIVKFIMLCKARMLNPWTGDAYLVGYDSSEGPSFSLIVAAQALMKRAENCQQYDGMESGIIVQDKAGNVIDREGDFDHEGDKIVGAWAKVYRKDRSHPSTDRLKFATFNTGRSRWQKDPGGMIVKCAEASALRKAFPLELGGMYTREEMESVEHHPNEPKKLGVDGLLDKLKESAPAVEAKEEPNGGGKTKPGELFDHEVEGYHGD